MAYILTVVLTVGLKKKLLKAAKKKKFKAIQPWIGVCALNNRKNNNLMQITKVVKFIRTLHFLQSIINHIYWIASSSSEEPEKEEKWLSLLNHIVNIHVHKDNKLFKACTHETVDRQWIKAGEMTAS